MKSNNKIKIVDRQIDRSIDWDKEIKFLESYFKDFIIPKDFIYDKCQKIKDGKLFIDTHLNIIKNNKNKSLIIPYYERLIRIKELL